MPIVNYTTKIAAAKTIGEIQQILAKNGAKKIVCDYSDDGLPTAVTFGFNMADRLTWFSLPANYTGVLKVMQHDPDVPQKFCNHEQSIRVAWRILKDWIEAQCAINAAGMVDMAEIFLPYAVTKTGGTLYQQIKERPQLLLNQ